MTEKEESNGIATTTADASKKSSVTIVAVEETGNSNSNSLAVIPDVAIRWIILHATTSNVELAWLSNVNRSWRDIVTTVILEQATYKVTPSLPLLLLPSMASQLIRLNTISMDESSKEDQSEQDIHQQQQQQAAMKVEETFCAAWFAPEGIQLLDLDAEQQSSDADQDESSEDYGHQYHSTSKSAMQRMHRKNRQANNSSSPAVNGNNNSNNPTNNNANTNNGSSNNNSNNKKRSKSPKMFIQRRAAPPLEQIPAQAQMKGWGRGHGPNAKPHAKFKLSYEDQGIMVSHEWQGYRHAMQILHPFGYAEPFVQHVLQQAQVHDQMRRRQSSLRRMKSIDQHTTVNLPHEDAPTNRQAVTQTTLAVRGSTIARPEGYCLCWEYPAQAAPTQQVEWSRTNSNNSNTGSTNNPHHDEMVQTIKWQERQRKLKQWKEWRRQLQLTVLPQVLVRKPPTSNAVVQFLNVDEKHAVRLATPPFACGPLGEPVTILIVGIATEDGCFCSGLRHRFEVGHLYPNTPICELSELSPVCMATDAWEYHPPPLSQQQHRLSQRSLRTPLERQLFPDEDDDDDSEESDDDYNSDDDDDDDDSSSDFVGGSSTISKKNSWLNQCTCMFQDTSDPCNLAGDPTATTCVTAAMVSQQQQQQQSNEKEDSNSQTMRVEDEESSDEDDNDNLADDEGEDDHDAERILRGSRIPGMWHCYTAVFDGKQSILRVDGVQEVLTSSKPKHKVDNGSGNNSKNGRRPPPKSGPRPMLDGLTIGSDHCFDMTLCFGQGSGGEGEGAIAEIAVFSGCLDISDLEVLELELMTKHGIPTPDLSREALVREDDWTRKSHALYCQLPPEPPGSNRPRPNHGPPLSFEGDSIPLRIMTKHRSVAWHQFNAVTGEELRIKRIGSRSAGSSSDW